MQGGKKELQRYQTAKGQAPFWDWLYSLNDSHTRSVILNRLERMAEGNPGNWRSVGQGVFELKIFFGPGYRVYFGVDGLRLVILLCGGAKASQRRDIFKAQGYWKDYHERRKIWNPASGYHEDLIKHLKNPREACTYLNAALAEGDRRHFLRALRNVAEAQGGLLALAKRTHMNRSHLYRLLSEGETRKCASLEKTS